MRNNTRARLITAPDVFVGFMKPFHHQQTALHVAARLVKRGVPAIAVTGSVARGRATPASDVDLWLLWDRDERVHLQVKGMPVTLLTQTFERAVTPENLALYDVDDLWVLHDPQLLFARLKRIHAQKRSHIRAAVLDATLESLLDSTRRALIGSAWHRMMELREVAWRAASLWLFDEHGWRISKLRHMQQHLPKAAVKPLLGALGLPLTSSAWARLVKQWTRYTRTVSRKHAPALVQQPTQLARMRAVGHAGDAVMSVRRLLDLELMPRVLDEENQWDPALLQHHGPLVDAWRAAHALTMDADDITSTRVTARCVQSLCKALHTAAHFDDPAELLDLWALARRA